MVSVECSPEENGDRLGGILTEFQTLLSKLYDVITYENEKEMSRLVHLTKLYSTISDVQKTEVERKVLDSTERTERVTALNLPELEESNRLLDRCKKIKQKFQSSARPSVPKEKITKPVSQDYLNHKKLSSSGRNQMNERPKKTSTVPKYSVISQSSLQQLSVLVKQKEVPSEKQLVSIPDGRPVPVPSEISLQQLLDKNRALEAKLRLCLDQQRPQTSVLFLERMGSSIIKDCCILSHEKELKNGGRHISTNTDRPEEIVSYGTEDESAKCALLCKEQFAQFHSQVHWFVKNNILPLLDECSKNVRGAPEASIQLLQSLLQLSVFEEDHKSDCMILQDS